MTRTPRSATHFSASSQFARSAADIAVKAAAVMDRSSVTSVFSRMTSGWLWGWLEGRRQGARSTRRRDACWASATRALAGDVELQRDGDDSDVGGNEEQGGADEAVHHSVPYFVDGVGVVGTFGTGRLGTVTPGSDVTIDGPLVVRP